MVSDFTSPYELEAERAVCAAAMERPEIAASFVLEKGDFHDPLCAATWEVFRDLRRGRMQVSLLAISDALERSERVPRGVLPKLTAMLGDVATHDVAHVHAEMVRTAAMRRRIAIAAGELVESAKALASPAELLARLDESVSGVRRSVDSGFGASLARVASEAASRKEMASRVIPFNVPFFDDACGGIHPADLIVLCAASGAGKTTIASLIAQQAAKQRRRVHFFALEAHENEIEQRMLFREICAVLRERGMMNADIRFAAWMYGRLASVISDDIERVARARLASDIETMRTYYRGVKFTHADVLRLFNSVRNETDLIILDHLHYVDSDGASENETLRDTIKAIRDCSLAIGKPVIVVAHLRKKDRARPRIIPDIDDVHGSSDIVKASTKVVMLAPARDRVDGDPSLANTYMQVVKERFDGVQNYAALCSYDMRTLSYREQYLLGRISPAGDKFENVPADQHPQWATRGLCVGTPAGVL